MKKNLILCAAVCSTLISPAQNFEGRITYQNSYQSKLPGLDDTQLGAMMGTKQEYYIKGGNYKSVVNGSFSQWQIYVNSENKLYSKLSNSETIFWTDGQDDGDSITGSQLNKGAAKILGYTCDELILTHKNGSHKFYFNSSLGVDPTFFTKHKSGNWYEYVKQAKAVPLKIIIDNPQITMESIATEAKSMQLDDKLFQLPKDAKTAKRNFGDQHQH